MLSSSLRIQSPPGYSSLWKLVGLAWPQGYWPKWWCPLQNSPRLVHLCQGPSAGGGAVALWTLHLYLGLMEFLWDWHLPGWGLPSLALLQAGLSRQGCVCSALTHAWRRQPESLPGNSGGARQPALLPVISLSPAPAHRVPASAVGSSWLHRAL